MTELSHFRRFSVAPRVDLPSTAELLADGGDARLALDPRRGTNKYGCRPFPDPELAPFGSSTASIVSESGFAAAEELRARLVERASLEPSHVTYARELQRLRDELLRWCGLAESSGTEIVLAASGTDLHLIAARLAAGGESLRALAVEAAETGSGVPAALAGRHFSTATALGQSVIDGLPVPGVDAVEVVPVATRAADGRERSAADISAEIATRAREAVDDGSRVLVTVTDVSKTGLLSPGLDCVLDLQRRFPGSVDVLVDACQFRLAPGTVRAYLAHGFLVAVTGSKFVTGPAFCGALFVPPRLAPRFKERALPAGLAAYCARGEWPQDWRAADSLPDLANYGLLLRWRAALTELQAFTALPPQDVARFVAEFGYAVQARFVADPRFEAVPAPLLDRRAIAAPSSWDHLPTIFPFLLRDPSGTRYLSRPETQRVYGLLGADIAHRLGRPGGKAVAALRCHVGQPVACGERAGVAVSALRLCLSARLIARAVGGGRAPDVIGQALAVLDKAALILDSL